MKNRLRLLALLSVLVVSATGCRTWQPSDVRPETLLARDAPNRIRVTRADGMRLTLERPELRAGAIVATAAPGAVLVENIRLLETRQVSVARTIAFVLPGAVFVALVGKSVCRC